MGWPKNNADRKQELIAQGLSDEEATEQIADEIDAANPADDDD